MRLAGGKAGPHRQSVGVNHGVDFAGQSASRAAHVLLTIFRDACSMLVHAYNGRIDHLNGRIVNRRQAIHDPIPDASPSPANQAIVASCRGPPLFGRSRHGAPDRKTQKMPLRTRRPSTRGTPRGLLGSIGLMTHHS